MGLKKLLLEVIRWFEMIIAFCFIVLVLAFSPFVPAPLERIKKALTIILRIN